MLLRSLAIAAVQAALGSAPGPAVRAPGAESELQQEARLFSSHHLLAFTIEAPLETIFKEREQESTEYPAVLVYERGDGTPGRLDLQVRTRGKTRLDPSICAFPPLRLNFKKKAVEGTPFGGADKLKLVTHCQDRKHEYEQSVLLEYLIYRTFNLLTDLSFRVRVARITYIDTDGDRRPVTKYAFLIEHEDELAARTGWEVLAVPMVTPEYMDATQLALMEVFQYFIGHTDFSPFQREPEKEDCCHNVKLIGTMAGPVFPIPYDFDHAGVIAPDYAKPDDRLPIRTVRDRLFRGICRPREVLDGVLPVFVQHKDAIYDLFRNQEGLDRRLVEQTLEYFDKFFDVLSDPRRIEREFVRKCMEV